MKMKDAAGKASTSLAITEKCQAPRPKGCAGIFFQLFDWHRRFAKKKLLSRKLLPPPPPARAKQPGRSFKGDEKMPVAKLHYIADENKGGFPNLRKTEQKHEMMSPGLVARLMGLESMPTTRRGKLKKSTPSCESFGAKACRLVDNNNGLEIGEVMKNLEEKGQMRHDRPQKLLQKKKTASFGAESLQIKTVVTRSRKQNHLKSTSPLKSPGASSRSVSRTSRLMIDAATRMLDPKNRTKCALTYVSQVHYGSHSEVIIEEQSRGGQSWSCKNVEEQPLGDYVFSTSSSSKQGSDIINGEEKMYCKQRQEEEEEALFTTVSSNNDDISFEQWCLRSERSTSKKEGSSSSSSSSKSSHTEHNQVALGGGAKLVALKNRKAPSAKDFVALNRSLSGRPIKAENSKADGIRKSRVCRDDSPTQIRKMNVASTVTTKPRMVDTLINQKKKDMAYEKEQVTSKGGNNGVISFTFNAPMKDVCSVDKRMGKRDSESRELMIVGGSEKKEPIRKQLGGLRVRGDDALGALLEHKLKELTCQEDEEMNNNNTYANPKRTTAMILQELIAALTADPLLSQDTLLGEESQNKAVQVKAKKEGIVGEVNSDANRFSVGSVLDASSFYSRFDDSSSGLKLKADSSSSCHQQQPLDTENDVVLDCGDKVMNLIVRINNLFSELYVGGVRLEGSKLIHAKEINLHTQLLFSSFSSSSWEEEEEDLIINPGLIDELSCIIINDDMLLDGGKEVRKEFVFDCVVEWLESKYQPCCEFGYWRWRRLAAWVSGDADAESLMGEVEAGVNKWRGLSGMSVDEMIDWEMSHSLGKWLDFDTEAFDQGIHIQEHILHNMLQQLVADLF